MPVRKSTRQQSGHDDKADAGSLLAGNAELVFQSAKVPFPTRPTLHRAADDPL